VSAAAVAIDTDIAGISVAFVACIAESIADVDERLAEVAKFVFLKS
jgi:hypothetical protein